MQWIFKRRKKDIGILVASPIDNHRYVLHQLQSIGRHSGKSRRCPSYNRYKKCGTWTRISLYAKPCNEDLSWHEETGEMKRRPAVCPLRPRNNTKCFNQTYNLTRSGATELLDGELTRQRESCFTFSAEKDEWYFNFISISIQET